MSEAYSELNSVALASFPEVFKKIRELSSKQGGMNAAGLINTFQNMGGFGLGNMYTPNPYVQNHRIKGIETRPADYSKNDVADFLRTPDSSERELRAVEKGLEYTAYQMLHFRTVYQNLLTYHSYVAPNLTDEGDAKSDDFWREWKLLEKLRQTVNPKDKCHEFCGLALQSGKIFVTPRISVDKAHNKVNHAFLQQLPSDWVKIVGYNNVSKYTVAFDLMYFCQIGTDWRQFGDLFEPYIGNFMGALNPAPVYYPIEKKFIFAQRTGINLAKVNAALNTGVEAEYQNGRWYYWVTLPVDRVFPFEIDDTERNVIPMFAGMFVDLIQLSQMEQIQLEILQNPLVSLLHGEIPYWDNQNVNEADQYKLSNAGRLLYESLWYQMLQANNTYGIGLYMAPLENMKLESLNEAPNATEIVSNGIQDLSAKTGLAAIIPATADARAGAVQVSLQIESQMPKTIYTCFERMMNTIIGKLNLTYDWKFKIFGSLAEDEEMRKSLKEEMTLGILPSVIEYNALRDRSVLNDIAWSDAIYKSKLYDKRLPLVTSYNAKNPDSGLPPKSGRPETEGVTSEGKEGDLDSPA